VSRPNEKLGGGAFFKEPRVTNPLPANPASNRIHNVRGKRVILDADLAELYGVATKRLNQQVTRNKERFPADFAFPLSASEWENLRSQFATSSWGGRRSPPLAFTEHGALMAAGVLNSRRAIEVSIFVVRTFVAMREALADPGCHPRIDESTGTAAAPYRLRRTRLICILSQCRSAPPP